MIEALTEQKWQLLQKVTTTKRSAANSSVAWMFALKGEGNLECKVLGVVDKTGEVFHKPVLELQCFLRGSEAPFTLDFLTLQNFYTRTNKPVTHWRAGKNWKKHHVSRLTQISTGVWRYSQPGSCCWFALTTFLRSGEDLRDCNTCVRDSEHRPRYWPIRGVIQKTWKNVWLDFDEASCCCCNSSSCNWLVFQVHCSFEERALFLDAHGVTDIAFESHPRHGAPSPLTAGVFAEEESKHQGILSFPSFSLYLSPSSAWYSVAPRRMVNFPPLWDDSAAPALRQTLLVLLFFSRCSTT